MTLNIDNENKAKKIRLRAERRMGQIIPDVEKATGARGSGSNQHVVRSHAASAPTLSDLGISHTQSSRWQKLVAIPRPTSRESPAPKAARISRSARGPRRGLQSTHR